MKVFMIEDPTSVVNVTSLIGEKVSDGVNTYDVVFARGRDSLVLVREDKKMMVRIFPMDSAQVLNIELVPTVGIVRSAMQKKWGPFSYHESGIVKELRAARRPVKAGDTLISAEGGNERKVQFVCADGAVVLMGEHSFVVNPKRTDANHMFLNAIVGEL